MSKKVSPSARICLLSSTVLLCISCIAWSVESEGSANPLELLTAYVSPVGVCHVLFRNVSEETHDVSIRSVQSEEGTDLDPWWSHVSPKRVGPGEWTRVHLKSRSADERDSILLTLDVSGIACEFDATLRRREVFVTYGVRDPATGSLYFYLRNQSSSPVTIDGFTANGIQLKVAVPVPPLTIPPGQKVMLSGTMEGLTIPYRGSLSCLAEMDTDAGRCLQYLPIFDPGPFVVPDTEVKARMLTCPVHQHGTFEESAATIFNLAETTDSSRRLIHICKADFRNGVDVFAQCVDMISTTPQHSNDKKETEDWLEGLLDIGEYVKEHSEPGIFRAMVDDRIQYPGRGSGTGMGSEELLASVYALVASGAKHVSFRIQNFTNPGPLQAIPRLTRELTSISSLLEISEPVDMVSHVSQPDVVCRSILCGDKAVIVLAIRKTPVASKAPDSVDITLDPPEWMHLKSYLRIGGTVGRQALSASEEGPCLLGELIESAAMYLVPNE